MSKRFFCIVPAAGSGSRMQAERPKQYLSITTSKGELSLLEITLQRLASLSCLESITVALSADDGFFSQLTVPANTHSVEGGKERADSVLSALQSLPADDDDWVLVHDAARCCVSHSDLENLIMSLRDDDIGGLLAAPASDTIKLADSENRVDKTLDRQQIWQAQTPQMFRFGLLRKALKDALSAGFSVTDEASALEWAGYSPKLVVGRRDNIKVTCPEDLALATYILQQQGL